MPKPSPEPGSPGTGVGQLTGSPGVATLLRGGNHSPNPRAEPAPPPELPCRMRPRRLVRVTLVLTDLLLLTVAAYLAFARVAPFGTGQTLLCCLCVLGGAWLSCLALWLE
jgi:hypothetical protein